jgi:hypothetical protein
MVKILPIGERNGINLSRPMPNLAVEECGCGKE